MPFFSIIIPTYNRAAFIGETISSLLQQTFNDFEIIVIDDGSIDNTQEIISLIKDGRIRYIKKENEERGVARNVGARLALGEYINFFDSDDIAYPIHLQTAYKFSTEIRKNCEVFHTAYDIKKDNIVQQSEKKFSNQTINKEIIQDNFLSCNNVFIRRDIALKNPFPEDRRMAVSEDWALWLVLSSQFSFYYCNTITSTIVYHDTRSVFDFNIDKIILRDHLLIDYLFNIPGFVKFYKFALNEFKANRYTFMALLLATKSRKKESLKYLYKAFSSDKKVIFRKRFLGTVKTLILK
jgi:glycosyltransferase involved in cell wall biosynthesis